MTPNDTPEPGLVPQPEPSPPPPKGLWALIIRHRFIVVSLVVLLFFGGLFAWEELRGGGSSPEASIKAEGPATTAESQPAQEPEIQPLMPGVPESHTGAPQTAPATPKTHEAGKTIPAAPESLKHPTAAPVMAPPPREPVKGEIFTQALIKIMDDQVNRTWFGWRSNTIVFGKFGLTDNLNNVQLGVLEVARRTVVVLNEYLTRFATTEAYNPQVNEAMNFFMVSPDKYWFPSASGKYREAMHDLETYIQGLKVGQARFYTRVNYLIALLSNYKDLLGSSYHNLIKDKEADGQSVSWFMTDDYFYYSQGIALGMAEMLEAVTKEFHQELQKKNSHKLMEDAIHSLHSASHLSPWLVTNGSKDGILANHRANMSTYIGEAEHVISSLQSQLATN
jgi:hypothetical protein